MFRWEFVFLLVVLISSITGTLVPEGSSALLLSKAVFALAFILFAVSLLRSGKFMRDDLGNGR